MVDPISIISLVEGSISLIVQCGNAIKSLNEIAAKYKQAELTLSAMVQEMDVIELAWIRIKDWFECYTDEAGDVELLERLDKSLKCGTNVITALQDDLLAFESRKLGFMQRSRLNWNEKTLRDHQDRIRGQFQAMSFLLQVIELPTSKARSEQLQTVQRTFLKSDESAYSIVPSRMSISSSARDSVFSVESAELIHHRWSFEGDLLGARVYKRNYAKNLINSVLHSKVAKAKDGAFTVLANDAVSTIVKDTVSTIANDAVSTANDELEASANGALGATGDDAPITNVEQGLVLLSEDTSRDSERHGQYSWLDIVAIPGLIDEPVQTWTHPQTGHYWLRDSLPTEFISARIFAFNYPSYSLLSDDKANIELYAEKLLSDLETVEAGKDHRKLVFIAHSYGGFLAKKAFILAEKDLRYLDIVRNTLLFCFLGTPGWFHSSRILQRFDLGDLVDLYLEGLGATTLKGRARSNLVETLIINTGDLAEITDAFDNLIPSVLSAYFIEVCELYATTSFGRKIVHENMMLNKASAWFVRGSHTEMCQFDSKEDGDYRYLVKEITTRLRWATAM